MGEISTAMIACRPGTWLCDNPIAASVPSETEMIVAIGAIISEFFSGTIHSSVPRKLR